MITTKKSVLAILSLCFFVAVLSLSGCSKEKSVTDEEMEIRFNDKTISGFYTGVLVSGVAQGEGVFKAKEDEWEYNGNFEESAAAGEGSFSNMPLTVLYQEKMIEGIYSGKCKDGIPAGEGTFTYQSGDENAEYTGTFSNGNFEGDGFFVNHPLTISFDGNTFEGIYNGKSIDGLPAGEGTFSVQGGDNQFEYSGSFSDSTFSGEGTFSNRPLTFSFQDKMLEGTYNGDSIDGLPAGEGTFTYQDGDDYLEYSGAFSDSIPAGKGMLETNLLTLDFKDVTRTGTYKGSTLNGLPDGEGTYTAINDSNQQYTHTGEWKNGLMNGYGVMQFDTVDGKSISITRMGNYEDNIFTPTFPELLFTMGTSPDMGYNISDNAQLFLMENEILFPVDSADQLDGVVDNNIGFKEIAKSPTKYGDKMIKISGIVIQIFEETIENAHFTSILVQDDNYNIFYIYHPGEVDIFDGDAVNAYGLPLGSSSFDNISGGITNTVILGGSYIEKR